MSDTKDFHVVQIARSDGADTGPGYWPSSTSITTSAAASPATSATGGGTAAGAKRTAATRDAKEGSEKATRTKAPMVRLDENDARFVEWRIKLGILLKQELSPTPDGKPAKEVRARIWCDLDPKKNSDVMACDVRDRRTAVVRSDPERVLAVRKVQTPLGVGLPRQAEALQDAAGVCPPSDLAHDRVRQL